jgi:hypothetical protein
MTTDLREDDYVEFQGNYELVVYKQMTFVIQFKLYDISNHSFSLFVAYIKSGADGLCSANCFYIPFTLTHSAIQLYESQNYDGRDAFACRQVRLGYRLW